MKRSELEKNAAYVLGKLKQPDYEIPSNRQILKITFYKLVIVYILQLLFTVPGIFINPNVSEYRYFDILMLSLGFSAPSNPAFLMSAYNLVSLEPFLGNEVTEQSVLLKLVERKINSYSLFLLAVNAIAGCILLSSGERFVVGLGSSWFVTCLTSMLMLRTSSSRYMTPTVVSSLSRVKESLPASPK